ncbi:hypothetical protein CPB86DRAFT_784340 [Serendipita vermifera]|nr:hypothetical protein CPB86DRAFT_784340 [Serendipita vermifera]
MVDELQERESTCVYVCAQTLLFVVAICSAPPFPPSPIPLFYLINRDDFNVDLLILFCCPRAYYSLLLLRRTVSSFFF